MSVSNSEYSLCDILAETDDQETFSLINESKYYEISGLDEIAKFNNSQNKLSLFNSNARSLMKHHNQFQAVFESIKREGVTFDVITFCETWLDDNLSPATEFTNYTPVFKHKKSVKEGGGLAAYLRDGLEHTVRNDLSFDTEVLEKFDGLFIELTTLNIVIGIIYRTPRYNSVTELTSHLIQKINIIKRENKDIILTGDFNIDLMKYSRPQHDETTDFLDQMLVNNLLPKVTIPTRETETSSTLIDHIFTNINQSKCIAGTLKTDISDHFSNFFITKTHSQNLNRPHFVTFRLITDQAIENLNRSLVSEGWNDILDTQDVDEAYDLFTEKFSMLVDYHLPLKTVKFNKYRHKANTWMTKGILKSLKSKEKLYIKMLKSKGTPSFARNQEKYKIYKNQYNKCIRAAKNKYWENQFQQSENDMRKTWEVINKVIGRKSRKESLPNTLWIGNKSFETEPQAANAFHEYFSNIGPNLAKNIHPTEKVAAQLLPSMSFPNSFFLTPTTPAEIQRIITKLKPKTSSGYDNFSPKLVKKCFNLDIPLAHIANLSMQYGIFPKNMKKAKVIAVFKKGNPALIENYRPISLLPTFSKVLERLVYNRLYSFLDRHKILSSVQYGFRKKLSTELAILELQDRVVKSLAKKEFCIGVLLDLSKAFDTLDHRILHDKLNHIGIRGNSLNWFTSYLSNRMQYTLFKTTSSETSELSCGVPQGSILGPLLFLLYINDINHNIKHGNTILFADDTNLLFNDKDLNKLVKTVNSELSNVQNWFAANKLSLNINKTQYIIFHPYQKIIPAHNDIILGNNVLKREASAKFLGVQMDENLSWKHHVTIKCNQIVKTTAILSRLKHSLPSSTLKIIYNSLVLPHISYALIAWGNLSNKEIDRLIILQKRALRIITKSHYNSHTNPLYLKEKLLKVRDIYTLQCIKLFLKKRQNTLPQYIAQQLIVNSNIHSYNTRQQSHIHYNPIRTKLEEQLINTKISVEWNNLDEAIKDSLSSPSAIANLKNFLLQKYH